MSEDQESIVTEPFDEEEELSSQQLYSVIGDRRRRYTVHYLKQQEGEVPVRDLAEQVAAWENGKDTSELSSQERKRVYISLYQSHLPTLAEEGLVEYDEDRKTVKLSHAMAGRTVYLEIVPRGTVPWGLYYLGLGIAAAILLIVLSFDLNPLNEIPNLVWAGLIVATLIVSAVIHTRESRRMRLGDEGAPPDLHDNQTGQESS